MPILDAVIGLFKRTGVQFSIPFAWTGFRKQEPVPPNLTYFRAEEIVGLDLELCAMLDRARGFAGIPFQITCGLRTPEQNAALPESVRDSAHLTGHAVDLHCNSDDSQSRYKMIRGLMLAGFTRIGVYVADGHIHADNDITKVQGVIWVSA